MIDSTRDVRALFAQQGERIEFNGQVIQALVDHDGRRITLLDQLRIGLGDEIVLLDKVVRVEPIVVELMGTGASETPPKRVAVGGGQIHPIVAVESYNTPVRGHPMTLQCTSTGRGRPVE